MAEKKKGFLGWFSSGEEEETETEQEAGPIPEDELTAFLIQDGDFSEDESGEDRFCPCGTVREPHWKFCPNCGRRIGEKAERYCKNCGDPAEETWDYCPKCGHLIEE